VRRGLLLLAGAGASTFLAVTAIALVGALSTHACQPASQIAPSANAKRSIPAAMLAIYQQVGARYQIPWPILAGVGAEECDHARNPDPSCTPQPGANGPGIANSAGAAGPMQIGTGGPAGDAYDQLKSLLGPGPVGTHDPTDAVELAALVLLKDKNAPTNAPLPAYLPAVTAYNGTGPQADAYAQRVLADATAYAAGDYTPTAAVGCAAPPAGPAGAGGYTNPFAAAQQLTSSRIDQGVDYTGTGPILALGPGRVYLATTTDTAWGNGNGFLAYTLTTGSYQGSSIYIAEGITPTVTAGQTITGGQQIATFNGHSIEIGFAAGPTQGDLALAHTVYGEGADTAAGRAINQLLVALGAPAGHRDLTSCDGPCAIVDGPVPATS
jgi:hypothetical protein